MLKILHKGLQFNAPLDTTGFSGDAVADATLASVLALKGGRTASIEAAGVGLCDAAASDHFDGFIINDVAGYSYENKPALASGIVPLITGPCVVVTDQIKAADTFAIGDLVYAAGGADKGLVTKTVPGAGLTAPIGKALSAASAASPELTILVF